MAIGFALECGVALLEQFSAHLRHLDHQRQLIGKRIAHQRIGVGLTRLAVVAQLRHARQIGIGCPRGELGALCIGLREVVVDPVEAGKRRGGHFTRFG